jgi:lysine-specific demethylase 8
MIKALDLAVILAGAAGERRGRQWVDSAFALLEETWQALPASMSTTQPSCSTDFPDERPPKRTKTTEEPSLAPWQDAPPFSKHEPFTPPVKHPVQRVHDISLEEFQSYMDFPQNNNPGPLPLIITGLTDDWPARTTRPWCKPSYLLSRTFDGRRLVPIELGRSYVDAGWSQKIVRFGDFLREHIINNNEAASSSSTTSLQPSDNDNLNGKEEGKARKRTGYLAQHPLLTHLPALRNDILVPDLCYTAPPPHPTDPAQNQPELAGGPQLNAWLGPAGTITPLHTDPYHNLLAQVVGRKYVRLYAPWAGTNGTNNSRGGVMRARGKEGGVEMGNTSSWDVGVLEGWDSPPLSGGGDEEEEEGGDGEGEGKRMQKEEGEEEFKKVEYLDCVLGEGDVLYIPIGWWHYVRGLSVSFSVSFWWN